MQICLNKSITLLIIENKMDRKYYAFARKCDDGTYEIMCEGIEPKILVASKPGKIREAVKRYHLHPKLEGIVIDLSPLLKEGILSENNLFNMDDYHTAYKFRKNSKEN